MRLQPQKLSARLKHANMGVHRRSWDVWRRQSKLGESACRCVRKCGMLAESATAAGDRIGQQEPLKKRLPSRARANLTIVSPKRDVVDRNGGKAKILASLDS